MNTKITPFKTRLGEHKFKRRRDVRPFSMNKKCQKKDLSIKYNLIYKETNRKCNIRNKWQRSLDKQMNKVFNVRSR